MKRYIWLYIIIAVLSFGVIYLLTRKTAVVTSIKTTVKVDTLRDTVKVKPRFISQVVIRHDTIKLSNTVNDTVPYIKDSIIYIPISSKIYSNSNYKAYTSGYDTKLDSLYLYNSNTVKTVTVTKKIVHRWGLGVSVGYGVSKNGLSPYIGAGITYNFIQ